MLHDIPLKLQEAYGLDSTELVTFRQLSMEALAHRDAVEFKNGVKLRLQALEEGQSIDVVALSCEQTDEQDVREGKFIAVQA